MKLLTILIASLFVISCSAEIKTPPNEQIEDEDKKTSSKATQEEPAEARPNKGICSFRSDPNKGCVKAVIASSELYIGNFYYQFGSKEFGRKFATDLEDESNLSNGDSLALGRKVTQHNFFNGWTIALEGNHTTYQVYHSGLGNLQVNGMAPGFYNILLFKEFELRILDEEDDIIGYQCATIYASRPIDVLAGEETALPETISEFELEIFEESCSGSKKVKRSSKGFVPEIVADEDEIDEEDTTDKKTD